MLAAAADTYLLPPALRASAHVATRHDSIHQKELIYLLTHRSNKLCFGFFGADRVTTTVGAGGLHFSLSVGCWIFKFQLSLTCAPNVNNLRTP